MMIKQLAIACLAILIAAPVLAVPTQNGVYEIRIQPTIDIQDAEANEGVPLSVSLGYYLDANVQLGAFMSFAKKEVGSFWGKDDVWGLGAYGELNIDWDAPVLPYIGGTLSMLDGDSDDDTVFVVTVSPGIKAFLAETLALSAQLDWNFASDEIYDFDRDNSVTGRVEGSGDSTEFALSIAVRFLFY